jgi:hypothetical protein
MDEPPGPCSRSRSAAIVELRAGEAREMSELIMTTPREIRRSFIFLPRPPESAIIRAIGYRLATVGVPELARIHTRSNHNGVAAIASL